VVPPALRAAALSLIEAQTINNGESNPNYKAVEVIVSPWVA
jgi:phage major head subunit gpT-like protein